MVRVGVIAVPGLVVVWREHVEVGWGSGDNEKKID